MAHTLLGDRSYDSYQRSWMTLSARYLENDEGLALNPKTS